MIASVNLTREISVNSLSEVQGGIFHEGYLYFSSHFSAG